jgi:hypothetical protein
LLVAASSNITAGCGGGTVLGSNISTTLHVPSF